MTAPPPPFIYEGLDPAAEPKSQCSRSAALMWGAPPSREADINPNQQKGGYPAPDRVTFLTGANRDFSKWRRQGKRPHQRNSTTFDPLNVLGRAKPTFVL